jgi:NIPSNAP protein
MSIYELATLTFQVGTTTDRLEGLAGYLEGDDAQLIGVFNSEISRQNVSLVIRRFEGLPALTEARNRALLSAAPFGCDDRLLGMSVEAYAPFAGFENVRLGKRGPYFEFRSYRVPPGGIAPTLEAWADMVPRRSEVSAPTLIFYALDGPPRFIHIWGYPTLAERESLRAEALARGVWPPKSAPRWLTTDMWSELFVPDAQSPLY